MSASALRVCALRRSPILLQGKPEVPFSGAPRGSCQGGSSGAPTPLERDVKFNEIMRPLWVLEPPNYVRQPLWRQFWEAQFANRSFLFFGNAWTSCAAFAAFLWWSRVFGKCKSRSSSTLTISSPLLIS